MADEDSGVGRSAEESPNGQYRAYQEKHSLSGGLLLKWIMVRLGCGHHQ
ncbi:unnamed protein product, partial [Brassica rapa]